MQERMAFFDHRHGRFVAVCPQLARRARYVVRFVSILYDVSRDDSTLQISLASLAPGGLKRQLFSK